MLLSNANIFKNALESNKKYLLVSE